MEMVMVKMHHIREEKLWDLNQNQKIEVEPKRAD